MFYMSVIYPGLPSIKLLLHLSSPIYLDSTCRTWPLLCLDEWKNFLERMECEDLDGLRSTGKEEELRNWASFRGQTLSRTGEWKHFNNFFMKLDFGLKLVHDMMSLTSTIFFFFLFWLFSLFLAVRGMMYYRKALKLQAFLDMAEDEGWFCECIRCNIEYR